MRPSLCLAGREPLPKKYKYFRSRPVSNQSFAHLKQFLDVASVDRSGLIQQASQMGYGNVATDYTGATNNPLNEDAATQALQQ